MSEKPNPALEDWDPDHDLEGSFAEDLPEGERRKLLDPATDAPTSAG